MVALSLSALVSRVNFGLGQLSKKGGNSDSMVFLCSSPAWRGREQCLCSR